MTEMLNISMRDDRPAGERLEQDIVEWITDLGLVGITRPYVWPGSWPANDLRDMALSLPGWLFDSAWIYYEVWDPEIPSAVERFNGEQEDYYARTLHREGPWAPPRDIIVVTPRHDADIVAITAWLMLGTTERKSR